MRWVASILNLGSPGNVGRSAERGTVTSMVLIIKESRLGSAPGSAAAGRRTTKDGYSTNSRCSRRRAVAAERVRVLGTAQAGRVRWVRLRACVGSKTMDPLLSTCATIEVAVKDRESVLVVDDEETMRNVLGTLLSEAGYHVELASSGAAA